NSVAASRAALGPWRSLLWYPHSEEAGRSKGQSEDQDPEDDDVAPGGLPVAVIEGSDQSDDQRAQGGTLDVPDAAEYRRRERGQTVSEAAVEAEVVEIKPEHDATGGGKRGANEKCQRDGAVDVYAHKECGVAVLGGRPHRLPQPGELDEGAEHDHQDHGGEVDDDLASVDLGTQHRELNCGQQAGGLHVVRSPPDEHDAFEDERHSYGRHERRQPWVVAQGAVGDAFDGDVDKPGQRHRQDQNAEDDGQHQEAEAAGVPRRDADQRKESYGDEAPKREHVAVGEVDQ